MIRCDVTDDASVVEATAAVLDRAGRIDLLVNNAGLGLAGAAEETSIDQAKALFDINLFGTIRMTRAVLPSMRAARCGRIVNVSSIVGLIPAPYMAVYAATKHAVEPANTRTAFDANLVRVDAGLGDYEAARRRIEAMLRWMMEAGDDPQVVADTVLTAARAAKPSLRDASGRARSLSLLRRFVPRNAFDGQLRKQMRT